MSTQTAQDQMLERDGARLRWRIEGSGPPLVLLHGWPLDLAYFDPVVPLLAPRFTVLRFDRRGFGLSTGLPDIHRNVDDLRAVLDAAGVERPVLLGMSQGARLALHFAHRLPARVRALVLDGAPAVDAEPELPLAQFRRKLEAGGIAALRADILAHPFVRLRDPARHQQLLREIVDRYTGLDLLHPVRRASPPDLAAIRAPTLVLNGSHDSTARLDAGRALCAVIPGARRVELADAGHLSLLDDPAGYAAAVGAFCRELPA